MELGGIVTAAVVAFFCGLLVRILGGEIVGYHERQNWKQHGHSIYSSSPLLHILDSDLRDSFGAENVPLAIRELQEGDLRETSDAVGSPLRIHELHVEHAAAEDGEIGGRALHAEPQGHAHESGVNADVEQAIASMTLGSVAFQMSLFYLVNHRDADMRRYSYGVIGETLSIFCAVLTFNTGYSWVAEYTDQLSNGMQLAALAVLCCFYFVFMEGVVAFTIRVRGEKAHKRSTISGKELHVLKHVLNAKTFGAGAAQMCGAACVRAFGHLQLRAYQDHDSVWMAIGVVPLAMIIFLVTMWISTQIRNIIIFYDGIIGETELTWAEVAEDCENEVCGLCMGFLLATVARMLLTGSLPYILMNALQNSETQQEASLSNVLQLFTFGFVSACITFGLVLRTFGHIDASIDHNQVRSSFSARFVLLLIKTLGFNFSWCVCFVMHFLGIRFAIYPEGIRLRLILALVQSILSILAIQLLDMFSNLKLAGPSFDKAITTLNESLAVSIGLSWEHAFHACVDLSVDFMVEDKVFFHHSNDPKFWSASLSAIVCIVVLPAYRLYIVPTRYALWEEFEEHMRIKAEQHRRSTCISEGRIDSRMTFEQSYYSPVYELSEYSEQLQALIQRQQEACQMRNLSAVKSPT